MCSRNLFKKVTPGEKEQIFQQNSSPAASVKNALTVKRLKKYMQHGNCN